MCPAAHPWVYRPYWKQYYDYCCATEHAKGNQYFMNSRPDLSTRSSIVLGGAHAVPDAWVHSLH